MKLTDQILPDVFDIVPYQAGKTVTQMCGPDVSDPLKLSSNENPLGTSKLALAALADPSKYAPHLYPDAAAVELRAVIGPHLGIDPDLITCGNGSNEVLELIATLFLRPGRKAVYSEHAFIVYHLATTARGATPVVVPAKNFGHDLNAMAAASKEDGVTVVFVANPNNPTGTWHEPEAIYAFVQQIPAHVLVVLDEAYLEYAEEGRGASLDWVNNFPNLVVTRTFSKIYGLAGLRLGYGITNPEVTSLFNRVRQPFNANMAAQVAAQAALGDKDFLTLSQQTTTTGMIQLQEGLAKLGYPTLPSQANFIAFCARDCAAAHAALLAAGIVVRQIAEYGLDSWLRTTVGTAAHNERLLAALPAQ